MKLLDALSQATSNGWLYCRRSNASDGDFEVANTFGEKAWAAMGWLIGVYQGGA
jgi:hypothetical protein